MNAPTRWHLPAVRPSLESWATLVTACGRRGPIFVRDDVGRYPTQLLLSPQQAEAEGLVCPECNVAWDAAEEAGALQVVWTNNGKRQWAAGGAVVFAERPVPHSCRNCRSVGYSFKPDCLSVVRR